VGFDSFQQILARAHPSHGLTQRRGEAIGCLRGEDSAREDGGLAGRPADRHCHLRSVWSGSRAVCAQTLCNIASNRSLSRRDARDAVTILVVPLQYRFAGTSRSRHRARFIPMPASAGGRSRTSPQSSPRVQKQRPIRNHLRLSTACRKTWCSSCCGQRSSERPEILMLEKLARLA
jgi:hypothetical protein